MLNAQFRLTSLVKVPGDRYDLVLVLEIPAKPNSAGTAFTPALGGGFLTLTLASDQVNDLGLDKVPIGALLPASFDISSAEQL